MAALSPQALENVSSASEPIIEDITELGDLCVKFTTAIVHISPERLEIMNEANRSRKATQIFRPTPCRFCERISRDLSFLPTELKKSFDLGASLLAKRLSSERRDDDRICGVNIGGFGFVIWTDLGSPACTTLIDRPPILAPHMNKVCDLGRHWQRLCSSHKNCLPEDETPMPTRVLALCENHTRSSTQLMESRGQKGRYIALSHCWGSTERQPLRTTSENFGVHQNGIAFKDLPKTFQDVVEFAQGIGIKYVWIDSLCIIQGNNQDWHSQAAKMGDIYRNAASVVAASGAKDSSEGLFITDRPVATVFRLPYRTAGGVKGTFKMTQRPNGQDWHPSSGPLERRAWTLQERALEQRLITFMPGGVTWTCHTNSVNEEGEFMFNFNFGEQWSDLLHTYTQRSLTFSSDRTEALRGIAEDFQRSRKDRYIPEYGVWEGELVTQLLWSNNGPCLDDGRLADIPSWSWVAIESAKRWPSQGGGYEDFKEAEEMSERLVITSAGHLQIIGHLGTTQPAVSYAPDKFTVDELPLGGIVEFCNYWVDEGRIFHLITQNIAGSYDKTVLGVTQFDNGITTSYTHACFLVKHPDPTEHRHLNPERFVKEVFIDDIVYHIPQNPEFVYWALLLELVHGNKLKRIGIATLLPVAYKAFQVKVQDFEII